MRFGSMRRTSTPHLFVSIASARRRVVVPHVSSNTWPAGGTMWPFVSPDVRDYFRRDLDRKVDRKKTRNKERLLREEVTAEGNIVPKGQAKEGQRKEGKDNGGRSAWKWWVDPKSRWRRESAIPRVQFEYSSLFRWRRWRWWRLPNRTITTSYSVHRCEIPTNLLVFCPYYFPFISNPRTYFLRWVTLHMPLKIRTMMHHNLRGRPLQIRTNIQAEQGEGEDNIIFLRWIVHLLKI
jgi:hypothetical protein